MADREIVICKHCGEQEYYGEMRWYNGKQSCRACYKQDYEDRTGKIYEWDDLDGRTPKDNGLRGDQMSFDYNYFTKSELVSFLNKHEDDFKWLSKPYSIMLNERTDKVFDELDKLGKQNKKLLVKLKESEGFDLRTHSQLSENREKWDKLQKELDKLNELAYGK